MSTLSPAMGEGVSPDDLFGAGAPDDPALGNGHATDPLQKHLKLTYFNLRWGIAILGAALPLLLWVGGAFGDQEPLRGSMSAYYHESVMRDTFVGLLVTIGFFLYLYKGFSEAENRALNLAGGLALIVAMVPTTAPGADATFWSMLHKGSAVAFFLCIAYVCVFRASDTLTLIRDTERADRFRMLYKLLGVGMVLSPVIAVALNLLLEPVAQGRKLTFFVEAAGVWVFAAYWMVKSVEMKQTHAEDLALEGKIKESPPMEDGPAVGRLVQVSM